MTTKAPGPRKRLIAAAIAMVQERGVHATGLSDLLKRSAAARNSIYQHFPGGKTDLMVAVTDTAATIMARRIERLGVDGPLAVITGMIERWVADMEDSNFGTGCPIAAAALAGPEERSITDAAARAFTLLRERVSGTLIETGIDPAAAQVRASFAVSAIEGALLQARAERSVQPLRDVEAELTRYFSRPQ